MCLSLSGCFDARLPTLPSPVLSPGERLPAGASLTEQAAFYRQQAKAYSSAATEAEAEAKHEVLVHRQEMAFLWGAGFLGLGIALIIASFIWPLGAILRLIGAAVGVVGVAFLALGELLPYLRWIGVLAGLAVVASLVIKRYSDRAIVQSWKASASALPDATRASIDSISLSTQSRIPLVGAWVKAHVSQLIKKF